MRIGFTIIFNGLHHLKHKDYAEKLVGMFDKWIIVEGAAGNSGSTSWCKTISTRYQNNGNSVDGTVDYLKRLKAKYPDKITLILANGIWKSKDEMVNRAIRETDYYNVFLWQIDIDEQWTRGMLASAERNLISCNGNTGMFHCEYYVGKNLLARGEWGEGKLLPYRRLWRWRGQPFKSHEPPVLKGGNGKEVLLSQRFSHYAYCFDQDVRFKNEYYGNHEGIYDRWKKLQNEKIFPQPISRLLTKGIWGKSKTRIICK